MRVYTTQETADYAAKYAIDLTKLAVEFESHDQFDQVMLEAVWGLLVCKFHGPSGEATMTVFFDNLQLTDGTVIDDDTGVAVHRWTRLVREMVKDAAAKATKPSPLVIARV